MQGRPAENTSSETTAPGLPLPAAALHRSELQTRTTAPWAQLPRTDHRESLQPSASLLQEVRRYSVEVTAPWRADPETWIRQGLPWAPLRAPGHSSSHPEVQAQVSTRGRPPALGTQQDTWTKPRLRPPTSEAGQATRVSAQDVTQKSPPAKWTRTPPRAVGPPSPRSAAGISLPGPSASARPCHGPQCFWLAAELCSHAGHATPKTAVMPPLSKRLNP